MNSSKSYKNSHEVNFFMRFARYLFSQGYHQHQITILVTYREQLLELQKVSYLYKLFKFMLEENYIDKYMMVGVIIS